MWEPKQGTEATQQHRFVYYKKIKIIIKNFLKHLHALSESLALDGKNVKLLSQHK